MNSVRTEVRKRFNCHTGDWNSLHLRANQQLNGGSLASPDENQCGARRVLRCEVPNIPATGRPLDLSAPFRPLSFCGLKYFGRFRPARALRVLRRRI